MAWSEHHRPQGRVLSHHMAVEPARVMVIDSNARWLMDQGNKLHALTGSAVLVHASPSAADGFHSYTHHFAHCGSLRELKRTLMRHKPAVIVTGYHTDLGTADSLMDSCMRSYRALRLREQAAFGEDTQLPTVLVQSLAYTPGHPLASHREAIDAACERVGIPAEHRLDPHDEKALWRRVGYLTQPGSYWAR